MPESSRTQQVRAIRRLTWESVLDGQVIERFHMDILPEVYSVDEPARVTVTQTRGAGFVDSFGMGFGTISMSGTTGFTRRPNANKAAFGDDFTDGYERWLALRDFFRRFLKQTTSSPASTYYMHFYNWPQEDYYVVFPTGLPQLQRSVSQPLLYRYNLQMTMLYRLEDTGYDLQQLDRLKEDVIAQLATMGPQRVGTIADQIDSNLATLWTVYAQHILNLALPTATAGAYLPGQQQTLQDQQVQTFLDQTQQRNKPAGYTTPTDSNLTLMARTRTLSDDIHAFTAGTTSVIDTTLQEVRSVAGYWRDVLDAVEYTINLPADVARQIKETVCAVQSLLLYPNLFRSTVSATLTDITNLLLDSGCATTLRF